MASNESSSAQGGKEGGVNSGATRLLKMNAGKADAIPAISHASASLRLVGSPNWAFDVPHQARTGKENPTSQRGIANRRKRRMATPCSVEEF